MSLCKTFLDVSQDCEEQEIFRFLCDLAILEEARSRLGDDETKRLLETTDDRNWMNSYRHTTRLPPKKKEKLLKALEGHMTPDEQQRAEALVLVADRLLKDPAVVRLLAPRRAAR